MPISNRLAAIAALAIVAPMYAAEPLTPAQKEVLSADARRFEAMVTRDLDLLDAVVGDEATYVDSQARIDDKQSILHGIRTGATRYETLIPTERRARVSGETAVVTGVVAIRGIERKQMVDLTVRYIAVYMKRNGRWQLTGGQSTQLIPSDRVISGQSA